MIKRVAVALILPMVLSACSGGSDSDPDDATNASVVMAALPGEDSYRKCVACHTIDKGGRNSIGPNLHAIEGRAVGGADGFAYSAAMKAKGGVWDEAALDAYLENPRKAVVGTRMSFSGISNADERKALIEYLKAQK